jgi:Xaa-Pro dipeptidase
VESLRYKERTKKLVEILKRKGIDGFIFGISVNMYYFTNFYEAQGERFVGLLVPSKGDPVFLVPELYYDQICETTWIENVISWADGEDPFEKMALIIKEKNLLNSKIAVDDTLRSDFLLPLQEKLPQFKFISGGKLVSTLRCIKSNDEKDLMMQIGDIHDKVLEKAISAVKIGVSELKVADLIVNTFKEFGAKSASIVPIVASGPYSAQPHYRATDKLIADGDSVVLDFTGDWKHYISDMTRTVFVGKPNKEYLKIYDIVRKAQETGVKSVRPGRTCEEIDQIVRKIIEDEGYGKYFIHRTGHGLGLEVHEEPYIVEGNKLVLEPGMTFSVEPGIYLPGKFGVRIEDCVIVTEKGAEPFTKLSHDLITI